MVLINELKYEHPRLLEVAPWHVHSIADIIVSALGTAAHCIPVAPLVELWETPPQTVWCNHCGSLADEQLVRRCHEGVPLVSAPLPVLRLSRACTTTAAAPAPSRSTSVPAWESVPWQSLLTVYGGVAPPRRFVAAR